MLPVKWMIMTINFIKSTLFCMLLLLLTSFEVSSVAESKAVTTAKSAKTFQMKSVSIRPSLSFLHENIVPMETKSNALLYGFRIPAVILWNGVGFFQTDVGMDFLHSYSVNNIPIEMDKRKQYFATTSLLYLYYPIENFSLGIGPLLLYASPQVYEDNAEPYSSYVDIYARLQAAYSIPVSRYAFLDISYTFSLNLTPGREVLRYIYEYISTIQSISMGAGYKFNDF